MLIHTKQKKNTTHASICLKWKCPCARQQFCNFMAFSGFSPSDSTHLTCLSTKAKNKCSWPVNVDSFCCGFCEQRMLTVAADWVPIFHIENQSPQSSVCSKK